MSKDKKIAYEKHPVSPERKAELIAGGFKIIDLAFKPEEPEEPEEPEDKPKKSTK